MAAPCKDCHARPKVPGKHRCEWCALAKLPIDQQVEVAERRRTFNLLTLPGGPFRRAPAHVPAPLGWRWCSGCQQYVPNSYVRGTQCRAHASAAAHASRLRSKYDIEPEEYQRLLEWQGGRCYICGQKPQKGRLAVDHDHRTGEVRGLLCAGQKTGCNVNLRRLLNDPAMARRAVAYVTMSPLRRMRAEDPPGSDWF